MKNSELQLLVYGKSINQYKVVSPSATIKIASTQKVTNPNYLFINLSLSENAKPGNYPLEFWSGKTKIATHQYQLKARRKDSAKRTGFNASDAIYLVMPDRFANGNSDNDSVEGLSEHVNRSDPNGRHGGDLQGIIEHLGYIETMGFTQLWLNPVLLNDHQKFSYHGYSTTDYYQVDPRFGSNQVYRELGQKLKQRGMGLIKDVIVNHVGTEHWWLKDLPSDDWINNPKKYVQTSHKRESLHDPHGTVEDVESFASGWFVPTMADLNQRNQFVSNYLIQNCIWWTEYADLSGLRVDTYSYSDKNFLADFTRRIMHEYPNYNIVAEEWSVSPNIVAYWQRGNNTHDNYQSALPSLFDFPLQDALVKALLEKESWSDGLTKLYQLLAADFVYPEPENLVVFADNHDMGRIYTQLNHDAELTKIAVAYFATVRGIPQFFYGTEILMENQRSDSHGVIRTDFPGGWLMDHANAFTGQGLSEPQADMQGFTKRLLNWRKTSKAVHQGKLTHYSPDDGIYVYFRHTQSDKVMIVINKNSTSKMLDTTRFTSLLSENEREQKVSDIIAGESLIIGNQLKMLAKSIRVIQF